MYIGLLHLHSFLRWVIIILAIVAIYRSYSGMSSGRVFSSQDKRVSLFLMISAHTTLLIGLYLWIAGPWGLANIQNLGFGPVMKDSVYRFFAIEHITGMLIAIVLITIGRGASKKNIPDASKFKRMFWMFLVALVIILVTVPWPFRVVGSGRHWI
ncbi:MAG: hypothetical protein JST68_00115 [Bacteroidetes bacterium]|nr:hypothetical protein [Bacteroidota bacterium]